MAWSAVLKDGRESHKKAPSMTSVRTLGGKCRDRAQGRAQGLHLRELRGDEAAAAVDRTVAGRCREFDAYKSLVTSTQWFLSRHRAKGLG
jgi:hypothetical protein